MRTKQKAFWVAFYPLNPSTGATVEFLFTSLNSKVGTLLTGDPARPYYPYLESYPSFSLSVFDGEFNGESKTDVGNITLSANNAITSTFGNYIWDGCAVSVKKGYADGSGIATVFTGVVDGSPEIDGSACVIKLTDKSYLLEKPLPMTKYAGTGNEEGPAELLGVYKPLIYGTPINVEPTLINSAYLIYQYHSVPQQCSAVLGVYENGLGFGTATATVAWQGSVAATYAALKAVPLSLGQWADCPSIGCFRLGGEPKSGGVITCDPQGTIQSVYDVLYDLIVTKGGVTAINTSSLTAMSTATYGQRISTSITAPEEINTLVATFMSQLGGYMFWDSAGNAAFGLVRFGTPTTTINTNGKSQPVVLDYKAAAVSAPFKRIRLGVDKCFRVHSTGEISDALLQLVQTINNNTVYPVLTSDSRQVPADSSGNTGAFSVGGTFQIYFNGSVVSSGVAYSLAASSNVTATINATTGVYAVTALTADTGTATFQAVYNGVTYTKVFAVTKAKSGANGTNGSSGANGLSIFLTNDSVSLPAYADGTVASYNPASGLFKVYDGNTDVSANFTLSTQANPQGLTGGFAGSLYSGQAYSIAGGFDANEDTATLTIRATGSGAYTGQYYDRVFVLGKSKGGYEIVSALPTSNLFDGRMVYMNGLLYSYTGTPGSGGAWGSATDASKITGLVKSSQIDAGYGGNLVTNPRGQDSTGGWTFVETNGSGSCNFFGGIGWTSPGRYGFWLSGKTTGSGGGFAVGCRAFPVIGGRSYVVRVNIGSSAQSTNGLWVRMQWQVAQPATGFVANGTRDGVGELLSDQPMPGAITPYSFVWTAPIGANWCSFSIYNWTGFAGDLYFSDVEVVEQVTTSKLPMGVGANLLTGAVPGTNAQRYIRGGWNPDGALYMNTQTGAYEGMTVNTIGDPVASASFPGGSSWKMPDNSNFAIYQAPVSSGGNGTNNAQVSDFYCTRLVDAYGNTDDLFPVEPGKSYELSVFLGPHRCQAWAFIIWIASDRSTQISSTDIINSGPAYIDQSTTGALGGPFLSNYARLVARGKAPSNARYAWCVIRKGHTAAGQTDSYLFGTRPMFAETTENATVALPYSPPPYGIVHAESIVSNTVDTRHLKANSVKTQTLDAYAVTATKMALTNTLDIFPDPNFRDLAWWNVSDVPGLSANDQAVSTQPYRFLRAWGGVGHIDRLSVAQPMEAGAWIRTKLRIYISGDAAGWWGCTQHWPNQAWYAPHPCTTRSDVDGGGYPLIDMGNTSIPKGQWLTYTSVDQFHPTNGYNSHWMQQRTRYNLTSGYVEWCWEITRANDAELIVDGQITTQKIAAGAVTAAKVAATNVITLSAQIGDGIISTAKIGDAQVDTLKIAGNAVTVPSSAYTTADTGFLGVGGTYTLQSLTVGCTGAPLTILASYMEYSPGAPPSNNYIRIKRDGITLYEIAYTAGVAPTPRTFVFSDTPSAGTHTYYIESYVYVNSVAYYNRFLQTIETKR